MNKKRTYIIYVISLVLHLYIICESVYAGLNGNAESVMAEAGKIFEYNGKYYQATDSALSSLREKLDGKDITEQQAAQAIAMINRNVAKGVEQGLLIEVQGSSESTNESEETESDTSTASIQEGNESDTLAADVQESTYSASETDTGENTSEYKETHTDIDMRSYIETIDESESDKSQTDVKSHYRNPPAVVGMILCIAVIILIFYRIVKLKNR